MKIIGVLNSRYVNQPNGFIVEMSPAEIERVTGKHQSGSFDFPKSIEICEQYEHAIRLNREVLAIPDKVSELRYLADHLEKTRAVLMRMIEGEKPAEEEKSPAVRWDSSD